MVSKKVLGVLAACASMVALGMSSGEPEAAPVVKKTPASAVRSSEERDVETKKPATADKTTEKASEKPAKKEIEISDKSTGEEIWTDLMAGNKRFVSGASRERELLHSREDLVGGQHPRVMVLGCADSRVSPELVFDKNLGELFVVRVAGNVAEPSAIGSLEYAEEHLHAKVLVILGHEKCGAVAAAASGEWMPSANLYDIVKRINPALSDVPACKDASEYSTRQVCANVNHTADDLLKMSPILAKAVKDGEVTVIRAVYHLKTGEVERLMPEKKGPSVASTAER